MLADAVVSYYFWIRMARYVKQMSLIVVVQFAPLRFSSCVHAAARMATEAEATPGLKRRFANVCSENPS